MKKLILLLSALCLFSLSSYALIIKTEVYKVDHSDNDEICCFHMIHLVYNNTGEFLWFMRSKAESGERTGGNDACCEGGALYLPDGHDVKLSQGEINDIANSQEFMTSVNDAILLYQHENNGKMSSLIISQNSSNGLMNLNFNATNAGRYKLKVSNMLNAAPVYESTINVVAGENIIPLDLTAYKNSIDSKYFILIYNETNGYRQVVQIK